MLILVFLISLIFVLLVKNTLYPVFLSMAETEAIKVANKIINEAIENDTRNLDYGELINYKTNNNGDIILMQPNVRKINQLSSTISLHIHNNLDQIGAMNISIPFLKAFGLDMLAGLGPNMIVRVIPIGFTEPPKVNDSFEAAGINQTRHKIYLNVDVSLRLIVPFTSRITHVKADVPVIEVTILGKVPEIYVGLEDGKVSGILENVNSN